jgi:hypothetical protein
MTYTIQSRAPDRVPPTTILAATAEAAAAAAAGHASSTVNNHDEHDSICRRIASTIQAGVSRIRVVKCKQYYCSNHKQPDDDEYTEYSIQSVQQQH